MIIRNLVKLYFLEFMNLLFLFIEFININKKMQKLYAKHYQLWQTTLVLINRF